MDTEERRRLRLRSRVWRGAWPPWAAEYVRKWCQAMEVRLDREVDREVWEEDREIEREMAQIPQSAGGGGGGGGGSRR